ncbi:hypothetical protein VPH35_021371 [Triticum aestivum]
MDPRRISPAAPPRAIVLRFLQPPRSLRRRRETSSFRRPAGGPCRLGPHRRRPDLQAQTAPGHLVTGNGFPNPRSDASRRPRRRSLQPTPPAPPSSLPSAPPLQVAAPRLPSPTTCTRGR